MRRVSFRKHTSHACALVGTLTDDEYRWMRHVDDNQQMISTTLPRELAFSSDNESEFTLSNRRKKARHKRMISKISILLVAHGGQCIGGILTSFVFRKYHSFSSEIDENRIAFLRSAYIRRYLQLVSVPFKSCFELRRISKFWIPAVAASLTIIQNVFSIKTELGVGTAAKAKGNHRHTYPLPYCFHSQSRMLKSDHAQFWIRLASLQVF